MANGFVAFVLCVGLAVTDVALAAESPGGDDEAEVRLTYGPIGPYDTLWSIARRVRPGEATVEQTMAALVRLNPNAFIDGDRNRIRGGMILEVPTEAEATGTAPRAASPPSPSPPRPPPAEAEITDPAPAPIVEEPPEAAVAPVEAQPEPVSPPEPVPDPLADALEEAVADRDRLAGDNAVLVADLERARGDLARAEGEIAALEEVVETLEQQVDTLQRAATATPQGRAASRDADVPPARFSFVAWGAVAVLLVAAVVGVLYQRRRVRALEATADAYGSQSSTAEDLVGNAAPDRDFEEPPPVAQDSPVEPYEPAETYEDAAGYDPVEEDDPAEGPTGPGGYSPNTKLNLARAYVNMGDEETAREVLEEVLAEGDATERAAAQELLDELE